MSKIKASNIKEISYDYETKEITIKLRKAQVLRGYNKQEVRFFADEQTFKVYSKKFEDALFSLAMAQAKKIA
jgi:hypothetical protein